MSDLIERLKAWKHGQPADAMSRYNCYRLAARIADLKDRGYDIVTIMEPHRGGAHARYYLEFMKNDDKV